MADATIGNLTPATALARTDLFEIEQSGPSSKNATLGQIQDFIRYESANTTAPVANVVTIDLSLGGNWIVNLTANVTSIVITGLPGAGKTVELDIDFVQDVTGGRTVVLPASFKALGGSDTAVNSTANAVTVLVAKTKNNGTTWRYAMQESA